MINKILRRKQKVAAKPMKKAPKKPMITTEQGYNPYDTLPGLPRERFGMTRQEDGEWTFISRS